MQLFNLLSWTWGLPLTLIGYIVSLILTALGYHSYRYRKNFWCFELGERWGGLNLGPFLLVQKNADYDLKNHEVGHAIQNCLFGPFTIILVHIPSVIRYWYYELYYKKYNKYPGNYYSIWFERQATEFGAKKIDF